MSMHLKKPAGLRQRGAALAVALVLLIVITLIGLGAARMSTSQERMTANFYDREIAFQNTEAAVREGALTIPSSLMRDCDPVITSPDESAGDPPCSANPFDELDLSDPDGLIQSATQHDGSRDPDPAKSTQYVVDNLGEWQGGVASTGYDQTANSAQYGQEDTGATVTYYRVTGRNGKPSDIGERAQVVLQAIYRK